ncbi:MAG: transcription antitermination factor NusB [Prolixibacteraceae bacterium]|jgi:transcription antitermination protein NusB|nr:transcription antitermination factor NusB [Prolixibacteraceae bacterium]MBT6006264.1 transcription antitermination factor NusB [Prolixibacteraceae bacterium]MBT6764775.1 transcription antitermination factor NusB [Prolixibacteraceae bacterium]MBT7000966.1 transcription antitermination factor NusB [Prolixibacteraceae bacterium]MBT7394007.1 transcription antitermination factor NusB [Prolixibacteraceae bacterium]
MISRRIIRTKVLQILYAYYASPEKSINKTEKELFFCIHKSYDLYHYLLALILEIADYSEKRIEIKKSKHKPTYDDLHPNTKFVTNRVISQLRSNKQLNLYLEQKKLSWVNHPELVKELYLFLEESDFYKKYVADKNLSFLDDRKFVDKIFNEIMLISEDLYMVLEEQSIYWNDDIEFVISMISKTLKRFNEYSDSDQRLMPMFKDQEDRDFAKDLFRKAIINHDELRELIKVHSQNWDIERIAFMDILIMQLAISELLYFPSIPTKVSLNEYIELSKFYSTEKSRNFINGILDKTLKDLKKSGKVIKTGRGLMGES